jgi:RNAse (barnase) inhibitor barstar
MRTLNLDRICALDAPWAYFVACDEGDIDDLAFDRRPGEDEVAFRILRGRRCSNERRLFQEWAAALQFPYYFGENWDALYDCLTDLEWLPARGYCLAITQIDAMFRFRDSEFRILTSVLAGAAGEWAAPVPAETG